MQQIDITLVATAISHMQQRMQQQQYHACNNSYITHATTAISRMQQQQYHTCNNSNITHATTAISHMQQQQYHTCNSNYTCAIVAHMQFDSWSVQTHCMQMMSKSMTKSLRLNIQCK